MYRCSQFAPGKPFSRGRLSALVSFRMPRIWPTAIAPELGGGKPQMRKSLPCARWSWQIGARFFG